MIEVEGEMRAKCAELKYDEGEVEKYWDSLVRLPFLASLARIAK